VPEEDVLAVFKKAVNDDLFRLSLARDLEGTLDAHNVMVTREEFAGLSSVDWGAAVPGSGDLAASWVHIYKTDVAQPGGEQGGYGPRGSV
jgi:hypothetical protein